jgi:two-component system, NarL family, invasion response regulator UvrY
MERIIIVDDHPVVRKGIAQILTSEYPLAEIHEARTAEQLLEKVLCEEWDIVICDINMPGKNGIEVLRQIKEVRPALPVIIMSVSSQEDYAMRALSAGASAYLCKDSIHEEMGKAVKLALQGRKYVNDITAELLAERFESPRKSLPHKSLSNRQFEILKALAVGRTVSEIALKLRLASTTISTYRVRMLKKMNMHTNAELTKYAVEHRLMGSDYTSLEPYR